MKATELRLGNYVHLKDKGVYMIDSGHDIDELTGCDDAYLTPIKLTPEWLERFGFEKVKHDERDWYNHPVGLIGPQDKTPAYGYMLSGEFDLDVINVHELQNLYYAVTAEELTLSQS